jgi:hypothetical protein
MQENQDQDANGRPSGDSEEQLEDKEGKKPEQEPQQDERMKSERTLAALLLGLQEDTLVLNRLGRLVFLQALLLLLVIVVAVGLGFVPLISEIKDVILAGLLGGGGVLIALAALVTLYRWEELRKKGMIKYEEVSDELEWRHRTYRPVKHGITGSGAIGRFGNGTTAAGSSSDPAGVRLSPPVEVRVLLRNFLASTSLPFAETRLASLYYAGYFLACILFIACILYSRP